MSEIMSWIDFYPLFKLQHSYRNIEEMIISNFDMLGISKNVGLYKKAKIKMFSRKIELCRAIKSRDLIEEFLFQNTTLLRQAEYFKDISVNSPLETRPILIYYSYSMLAGFFIKSLFVYKPQFVRNHGISARGPKNVRGINETKIEILTKGLFPRLVETLTLIGLETEFSPLALNSDKTDYLTVPTRFSLGERRKFSLNDILKFESVSEVSLILRDILLLFVANHLSRYKPYIWNLITQGIDTGIYIHFIKSFDRYPVFFEKIILTLNELKYGQNLYYMTLSPDRFGEKYFFKK